MSRHTDANLEIAVTKRTRAPLYRLDHLRAVAAIMVAIWHFTHVYVPTTAVPAFLPLSVFAQGHVGVSLFCVISGFLFAYLYSGRRLNFLEFARNRALRIAPLFLFWVALAFYTSAWTAEALIATLITTFAKGLPSYVAPGWTILVEAQFYILFPFLLLFAQRYGTKYLLCLILLFVGTRLLVYIHTGQVRDLAYSTIFGRIDQFLLGMATGIVVRSGKPAGRVVSLVLGLLGLLSLFTFYSWFNLNGGWTAIGDQYPWVWVFLPTIEACCFATLILGYLAAPAVPPLLPIAQAFGYLGRVSYSLYLNQILVFTGVDAEIRYFALTPTTWEGAALLFLVMGLPALTIASTATYYLIERPFLTLKHGGHRTG